MSASSITSCDLHEIESILEMGSGYVLDFSNHTFAEFFADLGIDIDQEFPEGSKANTPRAFVRGAEASRVAQTLEALLEHRGTREGDDSSVNIVTVKNLVARLLKAQVAVLPVTRAAEVLSLAVHNLESKIDQRLTAADLGSLNGVERTSGGWA